MKYRHINGMPVILSGSIDHTIKVWSFDIKTSIQVIQTLIGHEGPVVSV